MVIRSASVLQSFDHPRGGAAIHQGHPHHPAARLFHLFAADDVLFGPVGALDQNIGQQLPDQGQWRFLFKKLRQYRRSRERPGLCARSCLAVDRPVRPFDRPDRTVAVEADDQAVPLFAGLFQVDYVPGMKDVEAAVGEYRPTAECPIALNHIAGLFDGDYLVFIIVPIRRTADGAEMGPDFLLLRHFNRQRGRSGTLFRLRQNGTVRSRLLPNDRQKACRRWCRSDCRPPHGSGFRWPWPEQVRQCVSRAIGHWADTINNLAPPAHRLAGKISKAQIITNLCRQQPGS